MPEVKYEAIIFDLDGTLLDTSMGIRNSVRHTERMMGFDPVEDSQLKQFFGPPPRIMYQKLHGLSDELALLAARHHRDYAAQKGIYEAFAFDDVERLLQQLSAQGRQLAVATLKREDLAKSILSYFKLDQYFSTIVGQNMEENLTKTETINVAIQAMTITSRDKILMVGDSEGDQKGAREAGIDFLGVTYGFGFAAYMEKNPKSLVTVSSIKEMANYFENN